MTSTFLTTYTKYNHWANAMLMTLIESEVKPDHFAKEIVSSYPSLQKTIYHIWDAEFIWLRRLNGESLYKWPSQDFKGPISEVKERMLHISKEFVYFVEGKTDEDLSKDFTYQNIEGKTFSNPVWQSVHHCMNHSTYHRGQAVTMLRQLGVTKIPPTDFIAFCRV